MSLSASVRAVIYLSLSRPLCESSPLSTLSEEEYRSVQAWRISSPFFSERKISLYATVIITTIIISLGDLALLFSDCGGLGGCLTTSARLSLSVLLCSAYRYATVVIYSEGLRALQEKVDKTFF